MTQKIDNALARLNTVLPLKAELENSSEQVKLLYQQTLKSFVSIGRMLSKKEMNHYVSDVESAIGILEKKDMIVTSSNGELVGAYPFTMEDRDFKVQVNGFEVNTMCAVDALAVSAMYNVNTKINAHCRITGNEIDLEQSGDEICNGNKDVHVCVAWGAANTDIKCADSLCTEMFFVDSKEIANTWHNSNSDHRETFTLEEAIEFSKRFFLPLVSM